MSRLVAACLPDPDERRCGGAPIARTGCTGDCGDFGSCAAGDASAAETAVISKPSEAAAAAVPEDCRRGRCRAGASAEPAADWTGGLGVAAAPAALSADGVLARLRPASVEAIWLWLQNLPDSHMCRAENETCRDMTHHSSTRMADPLQVTGR